MYVSINKFISFQNYFNILSQLCQGMDKRHFLISNVFHRQHNTIIGSMWLMSYRLNRPAPDGTGLNHATNIIPTNAL
jgi:hypothetical protein